MLIDLLIALSPANRNDYLRTDRRKKESLFVYQKAIRQNTSLKNWRPSSLLNVVYKIISSACIANRIKYVLRYLINEDQTCFTANRSY